MQVSRGFTAAKAPDGFSHFGAVHACSIHCTDCAYGAAEGRALLLGHVGVDRHQATSAAHDRCGAEAGDRDPVVGRALEALRTTRAELVIGDADHRCDVGRPGVHVDERMREVGAGLHGIPLVERGDEVRRRHARARRRVVHPRRASHRPPWDTARSRHALPPVVWRASARRQHRARVPPAPGRVPVSTPPPPRPIPQPSGRGRRPRSRCWSLRSRSARGRGRPATPTRRRTRRARRSARGRRAGAAGPGQSARSWGKKATATTTANATNSRTTQVMSTVDAASA